MDQIVANGTDLLYLHDSYQTESDARVLCIKEIEGMGTAVLLDQTIFYPQGGGQPSDKGRIYTSCVVFEVTDVKSISGIVYHFGSFLQGEFAQRQEVKLSVDRDLRLLHSRLHSAGHLIDAAVRSLQLPLSPTKGYHFPAGPYVEYQGEIPAEKRDQIRLELEGKVNELVSAQFQAQVVLTQKSKLMEICGYAPDYLADDQAVRVVTLVPGLGCPCAGTHVKNTQDIGTVSISKIKTKSGQTRISYMVS